MNISETLTKGRLHAHLPDVGAASQVLDIRAILQAILVGRIIRGDVDDRIKNGHKALSRRMQAIDDSLQSPHMYVRGQKTRPNTKP